MHKTVRKLLVYYSSRRISNNLINQFREPTKEFTRSSQSIVIIIVMVVMSSNDEDQEKVDVVEVDVEDVDVEEAGNSDASTPTTTTATTTGTVSLSVTLGNAPDDEPEVVVVDHDIKPPAMKKKNSVVINEGGNQTKDDKDKEEEDDPVVVPATNPNMKPNQLSRAFYCPITKKIFQDPVVAPDGITYERQAILQWDANTAAAPADTADAAATATVYYPNRALQQVIAHRLSIMDDSTRSKLLRLQKSMRSQMGRLLEQNPLRSSRNGSLRLQLPDAYYCPITFGLMNDPVIDPEGNTFERRAIQTWIRAHQNSPLTRAPLTESQLYDNQALHQVLTEEAEQSDALIHPSIRKWKEETTLEQQPRPEVEAPSWWVSAIPPTAPTTPRQLAEQLAADRQRQLLAQDEENQSQLCNACLCFVCLFLIIVIGIPVLF
jgi:hypothetical protein